jgi:hypothetical protein
MTEEEEQHVMDETRVLLDLDVDNIQPGPSDGELPSAARPNEFVDIEVTADHRPKGLVDSTPPKEDTAAMPPPSTPIVKRKRSSLSLAAAVAVINDDEDDDDDRPVLMDPDMASIINSNSDNTSTTANDDADDNDNEDDEGENITVPDHVHEQLVSQLPLPPVSPILAEGIATTISHIHVVTERQSTRARQPQRRLYDLHSDESIAMLSEKKEKKVATAERKAQRLAAKEKKRIDDLVAKELKR